MSTSNEYFSQTHIIAVFEKLSKIVFFEKTKFFEKIHRFETFRKTLVRWVLEKVSTSTGVCEKGCDLEKILVQEFRNCVTVRFFIQYDFPEIDTCCVDDRATIRHKVIAIMQWFRNKCDKTFSRNTNMSKHTSLLWNIHHISCIMTLWEHRKDYMNTKREIFQSWT